MTPNNKQRKTSGRTKIIKTENLEKKKLAATARQRLPPPKKNPNSEDPSGSIRDITAHLIHDENTSIAACTVFNVPSAGYNPRWIYWSYEFLFVRPRGLRTQRPAQTGPGGQNRAFQRFDPMILCSVYGHFDERH